MRPSATHLCFALLAAVLAVCSCERRELWIQTEHTARVELLTDWSRYGETPSGMTVIFYPHDVAQEPVRIKTAHTEQADIYLSEGTYDALLFSYSEPEYGYERFKGLEHFETAEAYEYPEPIGCDTLRNVVIAADMYSSSSLIPYKDRFQIQADGVQRVNTLRMQPQKVVWTLNIRVLIRGIQNMRKVTGTIEGLSAGYMLGLHHTSEALATNQLDDWTLTVTGTETRTDDGAETRAVTDTLGYINTSLPSYGMRPQEIFSDGDVRLILQILLRDGETVKTFAYDVANEIQISNGELVLNLAINADTHPEDYPALPSVEPTDDDTGGGFDVEVKEWNNQNIEIQV